MERDPQLVKVYFDNLNAVKGLSPEAARDWGYSPTPEDFDEAVEGAGRIQQADRPIVIDDPELNQAWHDEQEEKARRQQGAASTAGPLTVAQTNENERREIARHRRRVPRQRRGR